jgi:succinyl-CoA synthetase alpha subunit
MGTTKSKISAFQEAGVEVAEHPLDVVKLVQNKLG